MNRIVFLLFLPWVLFVFTIIFGALAVGFRLEFLMPFMFACGLGFLISLGINILLGIWPQGEL